MTRRCNTAASAFLGKIAYETKAKARYAAATRMKQIDVKLYYYRCPGCRLYHLTRIRQP
jgi:hypothetical protein